MGLIDGTLQELEQEAHTTRRVLERVPANHLAWRPHEKARTLGQRVCLDTQITSEGESTWK
jgi:hypothetical protein